MMLMDSAIFREDVEKAIEDNNIPWVQLKNTDILITGATGLIGSTLASVFINANFKYNLKCKLHLLVRNVEKAKKIFGEDIQNTVDLIEGSVEKPDVDLENIDYIIHTASQTASKAFIEYPVETMTTNILGTRNLLELAKKKKVKAFVYLSTMEVYGCPKDDRKINEEYECRIKPAEIRNSYPLSKLACENLCCDYYAEYGVPTVIIRLTQTFGPGVQYHDGRVFAEFARCVIEERDIVLKTKGETKRNYLYTMDAVRAILTAMLKGQKNGAVYNAANEDTYCSIAEMAETALKCSKNRKLKVKYQLTANIEALGYAPTLHMNLDISKLTLLGWRAEVKLKNMYERLITFFKETYDENKNKKIFI